MFKLVDDLIIFGLNKGYYIGTEDDDPRGMANLDPSSMIGNIYVGYH